MLDAMLNSERAAEDRLLRTLIERRAVAPRFQPIVCLASARPVAFEALTRSADPNFVDAHALFDAADRCGRLWGLEAATRAVALDALTHLPRSALVFLNCSPSVVQDPRFPRAIVEAVRAVPDLAPERIVLELTERPDACDPESLAEGVRLVREAGFRVAVDDLGAGVNGLGRVVELKPDWLKLDRALTRGIDTDPVRQGLVRHLVAFTREIRVGLIAEGVEHAGELRALVELGVPHAQGYLLGRPAEAARVVDALPTEARQTIADARPPASAAA